VALDLAQWVMLDVWDVARKLSITEEDAVNAIQDSIVWIGEEMLPEDLAVEYYINRKSDFRNIIPGSYARAFPPTHVQRWRGCPTGSPGTRITMHGSTAYEGSRREPPRV
jgi:hypothetical protein